MLNMIQKQRTRISPKAMPTAIAGNRRGSAMLIVISLLAALSFLGVFFHRFVTVDLNSAQWFAKNAKEVDPADNSDVYFDWALEQVIIGPRDNQAQSALYGRQYSLVSTMLGRLNGSQQLEDAHVYSGYGIRVGFTDANNDGIPDDTDYTFDYNHDGTADPIIMNFSPAANGGSSPIYTDPDIYRYEPDAGYTYPDINNMALAHLSYVDIDPGDPLLGAVRPVWIPSFHRPQYFTDWRTSQNLAERQTNNPWTNTNTGNVVLRPHVNHLTPEVGNPNNTHARFDATFPGLAATDVGPDEGIWTLTNEAGTLRGPGGLSGLFSDLNYEYDIDADGDGVKEAIFLDLDFPVGDNDGQLFIPMYGITVLDADALLNVNVHGNPAYFNQYIQEVAGASVGTGTDTFSGTMTDILRLNIKESYSQSGRGASPFEVNLTKGFYVDPRMMESDGVTPWFSDATALRAELEQYRGMFDFDVNSFTAPVGLNVNGGVTIGSGTAAQHNAGGHGNLTSLQISNLEMARLIHGSLKYDGSGNIDTGEPALPGRYGDQVDLERFRDSSPGIGFPAPGTLEFPAPGLIGVDDDVDATTGAGQGFQDPDLYNALLLPTFHPIDVIGTGGGVLDAGVTNYNSTTYSVNPTFAPSTDSFHTSAVSGFGRLVSSPDLLNPSRWPAYGDLWFNHDNSLTSSRLEYNQLVEADLSNMPQNPLMPNQRTYWLTDEADELIVEPELADVEGDQIYPASEMMGLHLKGTDFADVSASSRLRTLLPFNFDSNTESRFIREQFTTASWDRMEFSFSPFRSGQNRDWEFNNTLNVTRQGNTRFPPRFNGANPYSANDPFRVPTRQLLTVELGRRQTTNIFLPQRKLRFHQIIDSIPPTQPERAVDGDVHYRNLTPHPVFQSGDDPVNIDTMWHSNSKNGAPSQFAQYGSWQNPSATPATRAIQNAAQEWWARYDRQRLARDIYVLLYTLGNGDDSLNVSQSSYAAGTDSDGNGVNDLIDRMAQFAVNVVDANDRDNVITRFAYDPDLSDGWDTDDANLQVVYGVEAQELTFSELLWLVCKRRTDSADHSQTLYDETNRDHQYLFMELRNATPKTLALESGSYRIRRVVGMKDPWNSLTDDLTVTFKTGNSSSLSVGPGENFLIGTTGGDIPVVGGGDDGKERAAVMRMQLDWDSDGSTDTTFNAIVPSLPEASPPDGEDDYPDPLCDLDLSHERDRDNNQLFVENASPVGYLLPAPDGNGDIDTTSTSIELVLERRRSNTAFDKIDDADNDWVEVDSATIAVGDGRTLNLGNTFNETTLYDQTTGMGDIPSNIVSRERSKPFTSTFADYNGANKFFRHSLGGPNIANTNNALNTNLAASSATRSHQGNARLSTGTFDLWQPHFDREFGSVFDVLSVPLFGPDQTISSLAPAGKLTDDNVGSAVFLNPGNPQSPDVNADNRWYRILEFFEVDPLVHTDIRNQLEFARLPGKINLNTIRNTGPYGFLSSLSALIDDDFHLPGFNLRDQQEGNRHWGAQFLVARDGMDPVWANQTTPSYIPLPGTPASKPFRPLGYLDNSSSAAANRSAQHTILRKLPYEPELSLTENSDVDASQRRQLFEARTASDLGGTDQIDFHSQHRLLSKIANNSTTKSHVFVIWIGVQFHKVTEINPGTPNAYYQVGEQLTYNSGNPIAPDNDPRFTPRRGFFVVDRSLLEEAYDPNTRKFDFRKFVVFRKTISE